MSDLPVFRPVYGNFGIDISQPGIASYLAVIACNPGFDRGYFRFRYVFEPIDELDKARYFEGWGTALRDVWRRLQFGRHKALCEVRLEVLEPPEVAQKAPQLPARYFTEKGW